MYSAGCTLIFCIPCHSSTNENTAIEGTEESEMYEQMNPMDMNTQNSPAISNTNEDICVVGIDEDTEYDQMDEMDVKTENNPAYALTSIS
jgi:hypothetical protein